MADKQWVLTKVAITSLSLVSLISICIGGANVLFEVKRDVVRVDGRQDKLEEKTDTHILKDEVKWEGIDEDIDLLKEKDHMLEMSNARVEQNQKEILRRIEESEANDQKRHNEYMSFIKNFERVD